ncbi:MAG TPA: PIN domain-containing protein [Steroidobacteraceae bacterium]|jgi:predicted nucleic acid-binding protein
MVSFDRFTVVLDACTIFPMLPRDVLLTLAAHEFFSPKWSPRIRAEWTRNLVVRMKERSLGGDPQKAVNRITAVMKEAFPDAEVETEVPEPAVLAPVSPKDRHVVVTAMAARADAIVTFNVKDFAASHLKESLEIEIIHPDDFVMDLVDLNEKRAVAAFRVRRLQLSGLVQTSFWVSTQDVAALI